MEYKPKPLVFDDWKTREFWFLPDAIFIVLDREPEPEFNNPDYIYSIKPNSDQLLFSRIYYEAKNSISLITHK